jgi:tRNA modification GTPase
MNNQSEMAVLFTQNRHLLLLTSAAKHIATAVKLVERMQETNDERQSPLVAQNLRSAMNAIGQIIGAVHNESVLDTIFSEFCIGKWNIPIQFITAFKIIQMQISKQK